VYRDAVTAVLVREPAIVEARGRANIEKAAGLVAGMLNRYPDLVITGQIVLVTFTGKNKETGKEEQYIAPQMTLTIESKSPFVRITREAV
jgi:hypothetical protein